MAALASIAEYFTLREARAVHARLDPAARERVMEAWRLGRQRVQAAESLWSSGHVVEGIRLAIAALDTAPAIASAYVEGMKLAPSAPASDGADGAGNDLSDPKVLRALALGSRGLRPAEIALVEDAIERARTTALPKFDDQAAPEITRLYEAVSRAWHVVDRAFEPLGDDARALVVKPALRVATAAIFLIGALAGTWLFTRKPEYTVHASAVYADAALFQPESAVDGHTDTWWLLPDRQRGWLEIRFAAPRRIERVRVLNTANAPHHDRGTHEYAIELLSQGQAVRTIEGSFEWTTRPDWVEHAAGVDGVDAIRFVVRSHHDASAGLTELAWD